MTEVQLFKSDNKKSKARGYGLAIFVVQRSTDASLVYAILA
jgi:hypothetical protein